MDIFNEKDCPYELVPGFDDLYVDKYGNFWFYSKKDHKAWGRKFEAGWHEYPQYIHYRGKSFNVNDLYLSIYKKGRSL